MAEKIKYVEIKGKKYPIWGGFYALEKFELLTGESSDHIFRTLTNRVVFIWCCMWGGSKMLEEECKINLEEFKELVNGDMGIFIDLQNQIKEDDEKNLNPAQEGRTED
jgi:hypothetical protein